MADERDLNVDVEELLDNDVVDDVRDLSATHGCAHVEDVVRGINTRPGPDDLADVPERIREVPDAVRDVRIQRDPR